MKISVVVLLGAITMGMSACVMVPYEVGPEPFYPHGHHGGPAYLVPAPAPYPYWHEGGGHRWHDD